MVTGTRNWDTCQYSRALSQTHVNTEEPNFMQTRLPRISGENVLLTCIAVFVSCLSISPAVRAAELRIPAFTAYAVPDAEGIRISERGGASRWSDSEQSLNWYGLFRKTGALNVKVECKLKTGSTGKFRMRIGETLHTAEAVGKSDELVILDFGDFEISSPGYVRFQLESLNGDAGSVGSIQTLILNGDAAGDAHFNLKERRNAASVHLMYPVSRETNIAAFYCEVTAVEDPVTTFYMACGWHRGYFGMQVNSPTERRIIFSVWDSGNEAVDRNKVADENRVKLMDKGEGVYTGDFGNEGTGGHSHLKYMWKTGEAQKFLVTAQPVDESTTVFSGYWFHPEKQTWMLISSWKAPKEGGWLRGPHSFSENFWGSTGHVVRKALYGNQWICTDTGEWKELTTARFSHDPTGKEDRLDRFMGVEGQQFFLSHGGFIEGTTEYGAPFERPAGGQVPGGLPPLKAQPSTPDKKQP